MIDFALKACDKIEHLAVLIGAVRAAPELYHHACDARRGVVHIIVIRFRRKPRD